MGRLRLLLKTQTRQCCSQYSKAASFVTILNAYYFPLSDPDFVQYKQLRQTAYELVWRFACSNYTLHGN